MGWIDDNFRSVGLQSLLDIVKFMHQMNCEHVAIANAMQTIPTLIAIVSIANL